ncbi:MAG TPA: LptE family protein [Tepidisphaeraceae bacterium]|nr:LptE family protein [Tepidisphaeraceae bacterium]
MDDHKQTQMKNKIRSIPVHLYSSVLLILCASILPGCGYNNNGYSRPGDSPKNQWYQWRSLYRDDVRTVSVPIFKNKDYRRGVEFTLSKAIVNEIEMRTPYKVVPTERADTILEGEIVEIKVHTLSEDTSAAIPQEQIYDIKVNFTWKDQRTGVILCDRSNFEQTTSYYPTLGEG